jgi:Trk K+ transport system NAD-binding subunit
MASQSAQSDRSRRAPRPRRYDSFGAWLQRVASTTLGRLALLGSAVLVVWGIPLLFGLALGTFDDLGEAAWSGVRHLLDPGSLGDDEGFGERMVGLIQVVAGIVLVVGAAFALLGEMLERGLRGLSEANPPVRAKGHVLVLGEGDLLTAVVEAGLSREADPPLEKVVVLLPPGAERPDGLPPSGPRLEVRTGDGHRRDDLAHVSAADARAIIVLSPPEAVDEQADLTSFDLATTLAEELEGVPEGERPAVAVQVRRMRRLQSMWGRMLPNDFDAVPDDRGVGVPLALAAETPAFVGILDGITDTTGSLTPFAVQVDRFAGRTFGDALAATPGTLAIGLLRGDEPLIVPTPDTPLTRGDRLIVMPFGGISETASPSDEIADVSLVEDRSRGSRVLVLGWSRIGRGLIEELRSNTTVHILVARTKEKPEEGVPNVRVADDVTDPDELAAALDRIKPDAVVVLGGAAEISDASEVRAAEARAALAALGVCQLVGETIPVIVEQVYASHAARLRRADPRVHVISEQEIVANALWLSALDRERLEVMNALGTDPTVTLGVRTVGGSEPVRLVDAHRALLERGIGIIGHERRGRAFDAVGPTDEVRPGDDLLVLQRA